MLAYTYVKQGTFALMEKPRPVVQDARDAVVRVSLASICTATCTFSTAPCPGQCLGLRWATRW